jgi:hypothetical protein
VGFRCPVVVSSSPPLLRPSGRPARSAGRPKRYLVSLSHLRRPQLGGGAVGRRPTTTYFQPSEL